MKKLLTMLFLMAFAFTSFAQLSTESFDGATFPPAGWSNNPATGSVFSYSQVTAGTYPTTTPHSGTGFLKINSFSYSTGTAYLTSPSFDLVANPTPTVSFWMYRDAGYATSADKVEVLINTTPGELGSTSLGTVNRSMTLAPTVATAGWYEYIFPIPGTFNGTTNYVIFKASTAYGNNMYLDDIALPFNTPGAAALVSPANGATGTLTTAALNWTAPTTFGPITGYKLYFGTDNPPTNIVNGTNLGMVTTYDPTPDMVNNTTYFWKVVPFNGAGDATAPVWSFTTLAGFGTLEGYVQNCYGVPVEGATVAAQGPATYTAVTGVDGFYQFVGIPAATYTVGAQKVGYNTTVLPGVVVAASLTTTQAITLKQPGMTVLPNPNNVSVSPNELANNAFTVTNPGCGELTWQATIAYGSANHTWFTMPVTASVVNPSSNVNVPALFNATGLPVGTLLSATVTFTSTPDVGTYAVPVNMVVAGSALVPVTNLEGTLTDQFTGAVTLTWECTPGDGFLYYEVKRDGASLAIVPAATTYNDVLPTYGTYTYEVAAWYADGQTAPASVVVEWPNPTMTWTPAALVETVWSGDAEQVDLTLGNTGEGTLAFEFPDYVDHSGDSPLAYCTAGSTTNDEHITRVQFVTIDNASASYPSGGYSNFTAISTDVVKGLSYPISVAVGPPSYSGDITGVWIDYDHNSTFDASEFTALSGTQATGTIAIPAGAMSGATTMRVRMQYNGTLTPCGNTTYGEVEDYTVVIKAPTFITAVAPATGFIGDGDSQLVKVTFSATDDYSAPGVYVNNLALASNDLAHASVSIPCTMNVTIPGSIAGVVTDCVTGAVLPGVLVQAGAFSATTDDNGAYSIDLDAVASVDVTFNQIGFQTVTVSGVSVTAGVVTTVNAALCEEPYAPSCASAAVNAEDTESVVTWCVPQGPYELLYDDGSAENFAAWQMPGNMNAVKFTPKGYPATVVGAKLYVGDGSFPVGGNIDGAEFTVAVYDVAANGMPGNSLSEVAASVTNYGWVNVSGLNATVASGDFFIVMIQGSQSPNCAPIGVDESAPKAYKSYSRNVGTNSPWVMSPYQDFMMHAVVNSPMSDDDHSVAATPAVPGKVAGMISASKPNAVAGMTGMSAMVTAPEGYDNSDMVSSYELTRIYTGAVTPGDPSTIPGVVIGPALTATSYTDGGSAWAALAQGWYAYGVKATYPNGQKSAAVYTNNVPHKMFADVTLNIQLVCGFVPAEGAFVTLTGMDYPYDVLTATVPASGTVTFDNVIKGRYDLSIVKAGYYTYNQALTINGNTTIPVVMDDIRFMPRNLSVDCGTLVATWEEPLAYAVTEDFEGGVFPPAGWQALTQGSVGWYATADGSSGFFAVPDHTTYAIANDDEGGSANNGCCDYLITPELDLTGAPSYVLSFQSFYNGDYGSMAYVEMSTDAGASWTPVYTVSPSGAWAQVDVDLSAYSGASGLASVWFTFHADDAGQWGSGWAIDDVTIASGGVPVQGYGVFLDATEVGQTQELTWTFDPSTITYGQTYVAGVAGLYCSGYSDLETYTFTSCFLYPPRNLQAVANLSTTSGAVILTWEPPLGGDYAVTGSIARTSTPIATAEYSAMVTQHTGGDNTDAMWDILLEFAMPTAGHAGIETDGSFIYSTIWSGGGFSKFGLDGTFIEDFSIAGVNSIRDLAYNTDNGHFYGSNNSNTLYEMDFTNNVLIGSVNSPGTTIRHIAYSENLDGGNGGFYVGEWASLRSIKLDGTLIANAPGFGLTGAYGSAYDPAGDKVWIFDQGGSGVDLVEFDGATMTTTGNMHAATDLSLFAGGIAGGLAYTDLLVSGRYVMLGLVQQDHVFEYDMAEATGGGGGPAGNLVAYRLYRDDVAVQDIPASETEYWDLNLMPAEYCYDITAVYDTEPYGFPAGSTAESIKEGTACVDVYYGFDLPFMEDWTTGQFDVNLWTVGQNWIMDGQAGNDMPSAKFKWDPLLTDYSESLESFYMNGAGVTTTTPYKLKLDFDLKLDDRTASAKELLTVEVWNGNSWKNVKEYANNGDFDWTAESIDISSAAKNKVFKVRFRANGDLTGDIFYWAVDNIKIWIDYIYAPPMNLVAVAAASTATNDDIKLTWNAPEGGGGGTVMTYILDDNTAENGVYFNAPGEGWLGNEFPVTDAGVLQSVSIFMDANGSATYTFDIFDATQTLVGSSDEFVPTFGDWTTVALPDVEFDGTFYVMLHMMVATQSDILALDENGPNAAADLEWYYDGAGWAKLTDFGFAPSVTFIRATGLVGDKKTQVTFTPSSSNSSYVAPLANTLSAKAMNVNTGSEVANAQFLGDNSEALTGYNVYRRAYAQFPAGQNTTAAGDWGTPIATVVETTHTDLNLSNLVTNCYEYQVTAVYTEGESEPTNVDWECIFVSVNPGDKNEVSIYPNPATISVRINLTSEVTSISVYNALGSVVTEKNIKGETYVMLNTTNYAAGAYSVKFTTSNGETFSRKFVVTK